MPSVIHGSRSYKGNFTSDTPAAPAGRQNVVVQASAPYPDPNDPQVLVRDLSAHIPLPVNEEVPDGLVNGTNGTDGNPTFTLLFAPNPPSSLKLWKNTGKMRRGLAFDLSGRTITYRTGYIPIAGDFHEADYCR